MFDPPDDIHLQRCDPARNMARFYTLSCEMDLFGHAIAIRRWGRIGTRGQSLQTVCRTAGEARAIVEELARAKRRRGYVEAD